MISISSTLMFREVCELCHSPPVKVKKLGKIFIDDTDLIELIRMYSKDHYIYMMSPSVLGEMIKNSDFINRIRLSYLNYAAREWKISPSILKRSKIDKNKNQNKTISTVAHCECKKTFWIASSLDRDIYPELNRKSLLRK